MRQKIKISLITLFTFFIQIFFAQVTISIPLYTQGGGPPTNTVSTVNSEHRKPLGTYFGYERTAVIFAHSEIGSFGQILSISVYCDSVNNPGDVPLVIYAREVGDSVFTTTTTVAHEELGAAQVYAGTIPGSSFTKNHWITVNFTTPFLHATSGKAVEFIFETNATGTGSEGISGKFFSHSQPQGTSYVAEYWNNDNSQPTGTAVTLSYYRPNTQLTLNPISACSGMPTGGTTLSTNDTLCANSSFVLSLQGNTAATGLSYQWQVSSTGTSFSNILSADSTTLFQTLSATAWYRCAVTCSGQTAYSTAKQVTLRNYMQCYCAGDLGGGCSDNTAIDSVAIEGTTLANGLTGCSANNYTLYPASGNTTATIRQNQTYTLDTRFNGNVVASFWIDYNQNGALEGSEWKQICLQSPSIYDTATVGGVLTSGIDSVFKTSFTVPLNAKIGLTLMRIRTRGSGNANDTNTTCLPFGSGETEDYYVYIDQPLSIQKVSASNYQISVYPNPANNQINIDANFPHNQNITLNMFTINGVLVSKTEAPYSGEPFQLDISALDAGIYFIKIAAEEYTVTKKIIVTR